MYLCVLSVAYWDQELQSLLLCPTVVPRGLEVDYRNLCCRTCHLRRRQSKVACLKRRTKGTNNHANMCFMRLWFSFILILLSFSDVPSLSTECWCAVKPPNNDSTWWVTLVDAMHIIRNQCGFNDKLKLKDVTMHILHVSFGFFVPWPLGFKLNTHIHARTRAVN